VSTSRVSKTIKVLIHFTTDGGVALGVMSSEWQGARRLDRRLSSARPAPRGMAAAPPGVRRDVWLAYVALRELVEEQREGGASTDL